MKTRLKCHLEKLRTARFDDIQQKSVLTFVRMEFGMLLNQANEGVSVSNIRRLHELVVCIHASDGQAQMLPSARQV